MVYVIDVARIPHCCGCGIGQAAVALIRPLTWEPPYAGGGAALKKTEEKQKTRSSGRGSLEMNPTRNGEVAGLIPGLAPWVKDLALLWAVV